MNEPVGNAYQLRPCPFCGGEAQIDKAPRGSYQAYCSHCSTIQMGVFYNTESEAVAAWNRRAEMEDKP